MTVRHARARRITFVLAVVGLLAGLAAPVSAADPAARSGGKPLPVKAERTLVKTVPAGVVGLKSYLGWVYDDDSIAVVGEIQNNTSTRRKAIKLKVTFFDSADPGGSPIGSPVTDTVLIDGVAEGGVGPFIVYEPAPPAGTQAFQIEITGTTSTTAIAGGGLNIDNGTSYVTSGIRYFPGHIVNPNSFAVDAVRVVLTAYNTAGDVGEVELDEPTGPIPAGGSAPFLIGIAADFGSEFTMASVRFLADGYRDDQPTVYVSSWANYYDDLAGTSFKDDIVWLSEADITRGCSPGKFCPNAAVSRGQMASFLVRALELPSTATDYFTDDNGTTHEVSINRVRAAEITTGCAPSKYCPNDDVSRGQMASFLARAFELPATSTNYFTDDNGTTHEGNINRVAAAGITSGCTATTYCPKADVTRGQMAAFLRRALE